MEMRKISQAERTNIGYLASKCRTCQNQLEPCPLLTMLFLMPEPPKQGEGLDIPVATLALFAQIARCDNYKPVWEGISDV